MRYALSGVTFACLSLSVAAAENLPTRLYVRTTPPGATVFLDGAELGISDGLFVVTPGEHVIRLERQGYATHEGRLSLPAEQITRFESILQRLTDSMPAAVTTQPGECAQSVSTYLQGQGLDEPILAAMLTVLRQHPTETRWSGGVGSTLFAVATKTLPTSSVRERAIPAMLNLTHSFAIHELLKTRSLLDRYGQAGLTDATTLRQAIVNAAGELAVAGHVRTLNHRSAIYDAHAVAYVIADESDLSAYLLKPTELLKVKAAYREVMHQQARELMKRRNWNDALLLWHHLHTRQLVSQGLYLDAARCFREVGQTEDAVRVLKEATQAFSTSATPDFLEQAGDIALDLGTKETTELAETCYRRASQLLLETVSQYSTQPSSEPK